MADSKFPRENDFSRKLHENERNWTEGTNLETSPPNQSIEPELWVCDNPQKLHLCHIRINGTIDKQINMNCESGSVNFTETEFVDTKLKNQWCVGYYLKIEKIISTTSLNMI